MYKYLKNQNQDGFVPNRLAFIYGNVKPDMNELVWLKHNYQETRHFYFEHLEVAKNNHLSINQRSVALGVISHFICDYFCKYHTKDVYAKKSLYHHFIYEFKLHIYIKNQLRKNLQENPIPMFRRNLNISEQISDYLEQEESLALDYSYTIETLKKLVSQVTRIHMETAETFFETCPNQVSA